MSVGASVKSAIAIQTQLAEVERLIRSIRSVKVILDEDIARLYGVETKVLLRAVKRNLDRFPGDFMFQLSAKEFRDLRSQFGTSSEWGGRRYRPFAFTEEGVAMLSGVLRSPGALKANIAIMRAFVRMRHLLDAQRVLAKKLEEIEAKVGSHDQALRILFETLDRLMAPEVREKPRIGFREKGEK